MDGYSQRFPLIIGANNGQVHNASLGQTSEPDAPHSLEKRFAGVGFIMKNIC